MTAPADNSDHKLKLRLFEIVLSALLAIVGGVTALSVREIVQNGKDIEGIKASRFTSAQGLEVWREISSIRETLAKLPSQLPPASYTALIDNRFAALDSRVQKMESNLDKIALLLQDSRADIIAIRLALEKPTP